MFGIDLTSQRVHSSRWPFYRGPFSQTTNENNEMVALFFCLASALVAAIAGETSSRPADENSAQGPALSVKFDYNKAFHLGLPKLPQLPQLTPPTTTAATPYEGPLVPN